MICEQFLKKETVNSVLTNRSLNVTFSLNGAVNRNIIDLFMKDVLFLAAFASLLESHLNRFEGYEANKVD